MNADDLINKAKRELVKDKFSWDKDDLDDYDLAKCHKHSGDYDKAIEIFQNILKNEPESICTIRQLGDCYLEKKEYKKATECYEKVWVLSLSDGLTQLIESCSYLYSLDQFKDRKSLLNKIKESLESKFKKHKNYQECLKQLG